MGSTSADLTTMASLIFMGVMWTAFIGLFYLDEIAISNAPQYQSMSITNLIFSVSTDFLSYMFLKSDVALINIFFLIPLGFIIVIMGLRLVRN